MSIKYNHKIPFLLSILNWVDLIYVQAIWQKSQVGCKTIPSFLHPWSHIVPPYRKNCQAIYVFFALHASFLLYMKPSVPARQSSGVSKACLSCLLVDVNPRRLWWGCTFRVQIRICEIAPNASWSQVSMMSVVEHRYCCCRQFKGIQFWIFSRMTYESYNYEKCITQHESAVACSNSDVHQAFAHCILSHSTLANSIPVAKTVHWMNMLPAGSTGSTGGTHRTFKTLHPGWADGRQL